jgi:hypothetical protein
MDGCTVLRHPERGSRAGPLPSRAAARTCPAAQHRQAVLCQHRLRQHHRARSGRALPRQSRDRRAPACLHALERDGDGGQGQPPPPSRGRRPRRPHRLLRLAGEHVRRRLQPLLACREREPRRRLPLHPGPRLPRHLCPRLPRRPPDRRATAQLPPGSGRQGPLQLPASQADAPVLAVPHGVDGPRPADGHLPGPLSQVPACPRHRQHREPQGLGVLRRRRNGRSRIDGRHRPGSARRPGQPDLRHQLQPAAPGRPGARQRQDHPGAGRRIPRLGLERHQADLGQRLGPADRTRQGRGSAQDHDGDERRRLPVVQGQRRRLRSQALLRPRSAHAGDGRQDERRRHLAACAAAATTRRRSTRPSTRPSSTRASPRCS